MAIISFQVRPCCAIRTRRSKLTRIYCSGSSGSASPALSLIFQRADSSATGLLSRLLAHWRSLPRRHALLRPPPRLRGACPAGELQGPAGRLHDVRPLHTPHTVQNLTRHARSYQNMFAALVPAVLIGAAAERGRFLPACIFFFCWSTLVYCPVVHWIWAPEGWAFTRGALRSCFSVSTLAHPFRTAGALDYAGGGPIEICSGVTGLVYSLFLGKRRGFGTHILSFKVRLKLCHFDPASADSLRPPSSDSRTMFLQLSLVPYCFGTPYLSSRRELRRFADLHPPPPPLPLHHSSARPCRVGWYVLLLQFCH